MEVKVKAPQLFLKKEIITKLSSEQMEMVTGGFGSDAEDMSCHNDSCNSQVDAGSCISHSCFCGS